MSHPPVQGPQGVPGFSYHLPFDAGHLDQDTASAFLDAVESHVENLRISLWVNLVINSFPPGVDAIEIVAEDRSDQGDDWVDYAAFAFARQADGTLQEVELDSGWISAIQQESRAGDQALESWAINTLGQGPLTPGQFRGLVDDLWGPQARAQSLDQTLPAPGPTKPRPRP